MAINNKNTDERTVILHRPAHPYKAVFLNSLKSNMSDQQVHGEPPEGLECLCTMEDITLENYVEYQSYPSLTWKPALYEQSVVEELLKTQFHDYVHKVRTTDCQAELRRLLASGPPVYIHDKHALALEEGEEHVCKLYFASDQQERSALLDGALQGEEREKLWEELKEFIIVQGKEEGDDDDKEDGGENDDNSEQRSDQNEA